MDFNNRTNERRSKYRFEMERELRYKVTRDGVQVAAGTGRTANLGSGGVAFSTEHDLPSGSFVELSISWPVMLGETCPMRLIVFGRVLRSAQGRAACSIDKYEFRTAAKVQSIASGRSDGMLQRWAEGMRKGVFRQTAAHA